MGSFDEAETSPFSRAELADDRIAQRTNLREEAMFVGRSRELAQLDAALARSRCVTIVGPGGVGKTRLARQYGWLRVDEFLGGVWFCDLSGSDRIDETISRRGQALVIFDGAEQCVEEVRALIARLLDRAPHAQFVITSRERLGLPEEMVFPLKPLDEAEGIRLFEAHAQALGWGTRLGDTERATLAAIVRQLDGIPMAIVLAASRAAVLSPTQILERLAEDLSVNSALRAAVEWSWNSLRDWEQSALCQCVPFRDGFSAAAAESLIDLSAYPDSPAAMDVLQDLVEKSLVTSDIDVAGGGVRLRLYECVRDLALGHLADGQRNRIGARHAAYYAQQSENWALAFEGPRGSEALDWLAREEANLTAAFEHSVADSPGQAARIAWALYRLVDTRGASDAHIELLGEAAAAAARGNDAEYEVRLLWARGSLLAARGRFRAGRADLELACERAEDIGSDEHARARTALGICSVWQARLEDAESAWQTALELYQASGERRLESITLNNLSLVRRNQGRLDEARALIDEAIDLSDLVGNYHERGYYLANRAGIYHEEGELDVATAGYENALRIHREVGNHSQEARILFLLATVEHEAGQLEAAHSRLVSALSAIERTPKCRHELVILSHLGAVLARLQRVDESNNVLDAARRLAADEPENVVGRAVMDVMVAVAAAAGGSAVDVDAVGDRVDALSRSYGVVRCAMRTLHNTIGRAARAFGSNPPSVEVPADSTLRVSSDGTWFRIGHSAVDLRRRRTLSRILSALTKSRLDAPGEPTSVDSLIAVGWPGERILPRSGASRVYMAVSTLRKLGLADHLVTINDGYLLDPERSVIAE